MASTGAPLFSANSSTLLVAHRSTLAVGCACGPLDHDSLSLPGGFSEHCALGVPYVLRASALSDLPDSSAHFGYDGTRRSGSRRRDHVGGRVHLLSHSGRFDYDRSAQHAPHLSLAYAHVQCTTTIQPT